MKVERSIVIDDKSVAAGMVEDRHGRKSMIIASQVPVNIWYEVIADPTIADAILDRIASNAHRIEVFGESLRKRKLL